MDRFFQRRESGSRRWTVVPGVLLGLSAAYACCAFLLRYFDIGQVLALISFLFLEILVILSVSRMPRALEEFEAHPGNEN
ncbi:MAG: hypothetical protein ACYC0F_03545 [Rhodanobacter sp.]